jgi:hypothetical protein
LNTGVKLVGNVGPRVFFLSSLCLQDEKPTPDPEGKEQTDQDDNKYKKDEKKLSTWHALSK